MFVNAAVISDLFCVCLRLAKSLLIAVPLLKVVHFLSFYLSTFIVCLFIRARIMRKNDPAPPYLFKGEKQQETDGEGKESNLKQSREDEKADEKQL